MVNSGYLYLAIIYIVWGTTYLAMRIGVGPMGGFPVFAFGAVRCLAASGLLLLLAWRRRQDLKAGRKELLELALTGFGMWVAGHGLVLAAERTVDSCLAAIAVASAPIWVLLINALWNRRRPDALHSLFVTLGFAGVAALMVPVLRRPSAEAAASMVMLILSPAIWAYCSVWIERHPFRLPTLAVSGYQHLFGGLGFLAVSLLLGEPAPHPKAAAWGALAFLVVFGSVIAYSSYLKALTLFPAHVVTTNNYVNPVIAVFLGALVLGEKISGWTALSMILVIISVAGVISRSKSRRPAAGGVAVPEAEAAE